MKSSFLRPVRLAITCACLLASLAALSAQTREEALQQFRAWETAFNQSRPYYAAADFQTGERILLGANRQQSGTREWSMESAVWLMRMAFAIRHGGQFELSIEIGFEALRHLGDAERNPQSPLSPRMAAAIKEMAGTISEYLTGSTEEAKAYYREAIRLYPESALATRKLRRFEEQDRETAGKQTAKAGGN